MESFCSVTEFLLCLFFAERAFDEDLFEKIVEKTNYYARQKVADNEQRLGRWRDVCKPEVKAYFGMCVIMGMNILPMVADY